MYNHDKEDTLEAIGISIKDVRKVNDWLQEKRHDTISKEVQAIVEKFQTMQKEQINNEVFFKVIALAAVQNFIDMRKAVLDKALFGGLGELKEKILNDPDASEGLKDFIRDKV